MTAKEKKEIRMGCLWGILVPLAYSLVYLVVVLLIPHEPVPGDLTWTEALGVMLKFGAFGFVALIVYLVLLVPALIVGIVLGLRDPSLWKTLKVAWPFLLALVYIVMPDIFPGPIDDIIVTLIASGLGALLIAGSRKKRTDTTVVDTASQEVMEAEVLPRSEAGSEIEKPREIIDVEFEDKS